MTVLTLDEFDMFEVLIGSDQMTVRTLTVFWIRRYL